MLLTNRKTLLVKQIDLENEIRGMLRVFGFKLAGRTTQASFEQRALDLVADSPRLEGIAATDACRSLRSSPAMYDPP